jgi:hypothetical protein
LMFCWILPNKHFNPTGNFFLIRIVGGGVHTGSTRHVGHFWPIVPAPGYCEDWRMWWNKDWQGKPKYSEKTFPCATLSTTNSTWSDPGANSGRRGGKTATNRLNYGSANPSGKFLLWPYHYTVSYQETYRHSCYQFPSCLGLRKPQLSQFTAHIVDTQLLFFFNDGT